MLHENRSCIKIEGAVVVMPKVCENANLSFSNCLYQYVLRISILYLAYHELRMANIQLVSCAKL